MLYQAHDLCDGHRNLYLLPNISRAGSNQGSIRCMRRSNHRFWSSKSIVLLWHCLAVRRRHVKQFHCFAARRRRGRGSLLLRLQTRAGNAAFRALAVRGNWTSTPPVAWKRQILQDLFSDSQILGGSPRRKLRKQRPHSPHSRRRRHETNITVACCRGRVLSSNNSEKYGSWCILDPTAFQRRGGQAEGHESEPGALKLNDNARFTRLIHLHWHRHWTPRTERSRR